MLVLSRVKAVARDPWLWAVLAFSVTYFLPVFRLLSSLSDEGVIVHAAIRILGEQVPYRDFFEFLAPGSFFVVAAWLKVFGATFEAVRILLLVTLAVIAVLTYLATRLLGASGVIAAALTAAWLIRAPHETNHHWFTTAAAMACAVALFVAVAAPLARGAWFAAGLFAGAATMITQTRGAWVAAAVVVVSLSRSDRRHAVVSAVAGMSIVPAVTVGYLVAVGAIGAALHDVVLFPLRHYSSIQRVGYGAFASPEDAGLLAFFPLAVILIAIAKYVRGLGTERIYPPLVLATVGFIGAYPRPDVVHLAFAVPFAIPLLGLAVTSLLEAFERHTRIAVAAGLIAVWAWHMAESVTFRIAVGRASLPAVATARGVVYGAPGVWLRDFAWLIDGLGRHTGRTERFFFYPYAPMLPFLADRQHTARLDVFLPGYTTSAQLRDVCAEVVRADWVVIDRVWTNAANLMAMHPALTDPMPPERRAFEAVLAEGFERVAHSPSFEVRRRTARATMALCAGAHIASSAE